MKTYLYAATFEPGFIKVGRSQTPHARLRTLKCSPGAAPINVALNTGKLLSVTIETKKLTEPQVHKRLRDHLHDKCREWFTDSEDVRAALSSMGFSDPPASDPVTASGGLPASIKCNASSLKRAAYAGSKQAATLSVAWALGEVTYMQAEGVLARSRGSSVYAVLACGLRHALRLGMIQRVPK